MVRGAASLDFCGVYTQFSVAIGYDDKPPAAAYKVVKSLYSEAHFF